MGWFPLKPTPKRASNYPRVSEVALLELLLAVCQAVVLRRPAAKGARQHQRNVKGEESTPC